MGSRTGSSSSNIAGKGHYIKAETRSITASLEKASGNVSPEEYRMAAIAGAKILIHTNPGFAAVYHTIKFSQLIIKWYPEIQKAYKEEGEEGVAKFLLKEACKIGVNVAISYAISEVTDMAWDTTKSNFSLKTTEAQDNIAKFIIGEAVQVAVDAVREDKPLDKDFFIKETINVALDGFITSMTQSGVSYQDRNDQQLSPVNAYSKLTESEKKLLRTTIQEVSHEIAGYVYDEYKINMKLPTERRIKYVVADCIKEKYNVEVEVKKGYRDDTSYNHQDIVVTDEKNISGTSGKLILTSNLQVNNNNIANEHRFYFNPDERIKKYIKPKHKDLLNFAASLFREEYLMRTDEKNKRRKTRPGKIIFKNHTTFDRETKEIFEELATHLLGEKQEYSFETIEIEEKKVEENSETADAICLFSGGLDSLAGYYWAKENEEYDSVKCVFVNHSISNVRHIVSNMIDALGVQNDFYSNSTQNGGDYLQQARGFLFLTAAVVYADIFKANDVVLSECGVTKYLPSFSPADELTKTTSPLMIKLANRLYEKMGINFELVEPFKDNTKAEIISKIQDSTLINMTHSCRTSNYMPKDKHDCGHCMNCLIKVIGLSYIIGEKQNQFLLDPITNPDNYIAQSPGGTRKFDYKKYEPFYQLVNFCTGVLSGKDGLHWSAKRSIDRYGKAKLYKRFSEDVIYGLSYMKKRGMVKNEKALGLINQYESESWFNKDRIERRRIELLTGV